MKADEGDYVICRSEDRKNKNYMIKVYGVSGKNIHGVVEKDIHLKRVKVTIKRKNILLNLGTEPKPGVLYGVDARDIFLKTITHDPWGDIHLLTKLTQPVLSSLKKALDKTAVRLDKMGFDGIYDKVCFEIRSPRGKYAGMYKHGGKDVPNRLQLFLKEDFASQMNYVIYHEAGHAIRYNYIKNPRVRSQWVKLYNTSVLVKPVEERSFRKVLKRVLESGAESMNEFIASQEKERIQKVTRTAMRYIRQVHRIQPKDVSALLQAGKHEILEYLWPKMDIDVNDLKPMISEYSTKNVEELFAESFAFYMTKKKIPGDVEKLLTKSLEVARDTAKKKSDKEED